MMTEGVRGAHVCGESCRWWKKKVRGSVEKGEEERVRPWDRGKEISSFFLHT